MYLKYTSVRAFCFDTGEFVVNLSLESRSLSFLVQNIGFQRITEGVALSDKSNKIGKNTPVISVEKKNRDFLLPYTNCCW